MRLMPEYIKRSFQASNKRHLLITGERGSGKSTLFRSLVTMLSETSSTGITTYAVPKQYVAIRDNETEVEGIIGRCCKESIEHKTSNAMVPVLEGFIEVGIPALKRMVSQEQTWISIDEIGYLEAEQYEFQNAILEVFAKKRVIAVIRKQNLDFLNQLQARNDVFVVDLDETKKQVGCILMASGLGKRFGGNKLLAQLQGMTLLERTLDVTDGVFAKRVVVTRSKEVADICTKQQIDVVFHTFPNRNDTVRLGVECCLDMDAWVFCPCDQPFLKKESLEKMVQTYWLEEKKSDCILRMAYGTCQGSPALFGKSYEKALCILPEKSGGSYIIKKYPNAVKPVMVSEEKELYDIDTQKDFLVACSMSK